MGGGHATGSGTEERPLSRLEILEDEAKRFYRADGSYELLESAESVRLRRVESAQRLVALEGRVANFRTAILDAHHQGCACDWHLYGEDAELLSDATVEAYLSDRRALEQHSAEQGDALRIARQVEADIRGYLAGRGFEDEEEPLFDLVKRTFEGDFGANSGVGRG